LLISGCKITVDKKLAIKVGIHVESLADQRRDDPFENLLEL
jgi:hypothetical protein